MKKGIILTLLAVLVAAVVYCFATKKGGATYESVDGDPMQTDKDVKVEIVHNGLMCVSPSEEGMPTVEVRVQNFITEQFKNMYNKTEELIQENMKKGPRIPSIRKGFIRKLSDK